MAAAFAPSCGGGSGPAAIAFSDLEAQVIQGACEHDVRCEVMPDLATCLTAVHAVRGYYPTVSNDLAAGTVAYDGNAAARCLDRLRDSTCSRASQLLSNFEASPDCVKTLVGKVPAGGACFFKDECADHAACTRTDQSCAAACCAGTCAPALIALGGDCSGSGARCVAGATCTPAAGGAGATCVALPTQEGADCTSAGSCATPLVCVQDPTSSARTCRSAAASGAACVAGPVPCDDTRDTCDSSAKVCRRLGKPGESCATGLCVFYATCDATTKVCVARGKVGEPCGAGCLDGLTCDTASQTCAGPAPDVPACN